MAQLIADDGRVVWQGDIEGVDVLPAGWTVGGGNLDAHAAGGLLNAARVTLSDGGSAAHVAFVKVDPRAGAGQNRPLGSLLLVELAGVGRLFRKTGAAATDWTEVGQAAHVDPATGTVAQVVNALIAAGLMAA